MITQIFTPMIDYVQANGEDIFLKVVLAIGVSIAGYILIGLIVNKVKKRVEANSIQEDVYVHRTSNLVGKIIGILLMIFLVLAVFQIIGFDTAIIMGGISLSLGFIMETTIENMVAGMMILTNKKVKIGDLVKLLGDINMVGTIEEITLRYSVMRTFDKKRTIIPNSILANTPIQTYKSEPLLRGDIMFTVPRHVHIPQVKKIIIETINEQANILYKEYTNVRIDNFDTRGMQIKAVFFANPKKQAPLILARKIKPLIAQNLKKYGISIPYPHITLTAE